MRRKFLKAIPKSWHCPYCDEWHKWKLSRELGYYDSASNKAELNCEYYNGREMFFYFEDDDCYFRTIATCGKGHLDINSEIAIQDIIETSDESFATFSFPFTTNERVGKVNCVDCQGKDNCLMYKLGDRNNSRDMYITFGFEFEKSKKIEQQERELKEQVNQQPVKENKEEIIMTNNVFNMNMEFGPNKDENIASTLMGVAVKNGDSWRIYDKKKKEITDVGNIELGNLPIFIMPTTNLSEGDLIKDEGEYYFVTRVTTQYRPAQTISARTGEMKSVIPIKNVLGFSCYSKVIALSDSLNMGDDFDVEKLAIMSAMCSQNGENGSQMNQLLPLMLFKDKLGGDDDTMKMLLMSSMMGGDMAASNNPLMSYLMLDTFMSKKDDKDC